MDRFSELPDSVIHLIFSFLTMDYVVRTTILSKRWRDLWTTIPCLHFCDNKEYPLDEFRNFVNRVLIVYKGGKIKKLTFDVKHQFDFPRSLCQDFNLWVCFSLDHEVEELYLNLGGNEEYGCRIPQRLFSYSSIRKLRLMGCDLEVHRKIQWNQLESLSIDSMHLSQFVIDEILLGSPQLEILRISCGQNFSIHSTSLKKLSLLYYDEYYDDYKVDPMLQIWSPNLEVLEISGYVYIKCLLISVPSLVETTLHFHNLASNFDMSDEESMVYDDDEESRIDYNLCGEMLREIFRSIHRVEKLSVGDWCIKILAVMKMTDLPSPLLNLKYLTLDTGLEKAELAVILNLLEISPNVGMLAIQNSSYKDTRNVWNWPELEEYFKSKTEFPDSFLMHLRIVKIEWFCYETSIFPLIEFVLKNARGLEKMVIKARKHESVTSEYLLSATQKLLRMPRSSPNAEVVLCKEAPMK